MQVKSSFIKITVARKMSPTESYQTNISQLGKKKIMKLVTRIFTLKFKLKYIAIAYLFLVKTQKAALKEIKLSRL